MDSPSDENVLLFLSRGVVGDVEDGDIDSCEGSSKSMFLHNFRRQLGNIVEHFAVSVRERGKQNFIIFFIKFIVKTQTVRVGIFAFILQNLIVVVLLGKGNVREVL